MTALQFFCAFSVLIFAVIAQETKCTYTSKAGDFYDLSPLSFCQETGYPVSNSSEETFKINICNVVSNAGCGAGTSVCQNGGFNGGRASDAVWADNPAGKGAVVTYPNGDSCPNGVKRTSILTFDCDSQANSPTFNFVAENPQCTYHFVIKTKYACPVPVQPQQEQCYIKAFLIPHSHDDVGWLTTIEDYFESQVRHILDTVVAALQANPKRKFIYVEQAYFTRWWYDSRTSDAQREAVKSFVKNGQWEFVIGAWVMPDEACTTYGGITDQMTLGHQFLLNTFGVTPTKGWQIDPFGASSVTPFLEKLAGFDAHIIDRITNKGAYMNSQKLQFTWRGSPSLHEKADIFGEIMGGGGYCDWLGAFNFGNDPVNATNVAKFGNTFIDMVRQRSTWYKTPNVLAEWGCDFQFQNAHPMFNSMDKVVDWLQANEETTKIRVRYSTLSEYFNSVFADAKAKNIQFDLNNGGDFMPYETGGWWVGYYTSRVELKGYVRRGEGVAHAAEAIFAIGKNLLPSSTQAYNQLNTLRVANGDAQHHDGVTGTSNPNVVLMYQNDLINGITNAREAASSVLDELIKTSSGVESPSFVGGDAAFASIKNGQTLPVVLFNSLPWPRVEVITLPVQRNDLKVLDANQKEIPSQISISTGGNITTRYELFFTAELAGLGYQTFFIAAPTNEVKVHTPLPEPMKSDADTVIENSNIAVTFSGQTGRISRVLNKKTSVTIDVDQNIYQYTSQHSGAYVFTPTGPAAPVQSSPPVTTVIKGPIVTSVSQTFSNRTATPYAKQTVRIYNAGGDYFTENKIEILFDIGPLPSKAEIIVRFDSSIASNGILHSDDNGYEFLQRTYQASTGIPSNYYPMVYGGFISGNAGQLSLFSERSHGIASLANGQIEVMIHRNPDMGDGFGPGLTDVTEVYPVIRAVFDSPAQSIVSVHKQPYLLNFPVEVFSSTASPSGWSSKYKTSGQLMSGSLPENIYLFSLISLDGKSNTILRLTHLYAENEHPVYSKPVDLNIAQLFSPLKINKISETTLSANAVINQNAPTSFTINPKEIRTFVIEFA